MVNFGDCAGGYGYILWGSGAWECALAKLKNNHAWSDVFKILPLALRMHGIFAWNNDPSKKNRFTLRSAENLVLMLIQRKWLHP